MRVGGEERGGVPAGENGAETSRHAEFARSLAGAQRKLKLQQGVLKKWNLFPVF